MRIPLGILIVLFCFSCGKKSTVHKKLQGCDSLVITFTAPNSDSVINIVNTTEKKAIRKLAGFLDGKSGELYKCGYDGHMVFYKKGEQVMPVVFKFTEEGCQHFLYDIDNKLTSTLMSNEEIDFLKSLKEGRSWY